MNWRHGLAGGLVVAALVALGVAVTNGSPVAATSTTPVVQTTATTTPPAMPAAKPATTTTAMPARGTIGPVAKPTMVHVPAIGVDSTLIPLGIQGRDGVPVTTKAGELQEIPVDMPKQAGYFSLGFLPGQIGSAAILAHVDGDHMLGLFHDLGKLKAGDKITVDRSDGSSVTFTVTHVKTILKKDFNPKAEYGSATDAELHLISCGGRFDPVTHQYVSNIIADSVLTSTS